MKTADSSSPVLVVDDSLTQLAVLRDALEERGLSVETAQNGMEAIARVHQVRPRLILSDVMMPELNGYHLCRLLKNDPCTAHIPVILLTNLREPLDRFWGENAGADLYLEKGEDLVPIVDAVLSLLPAVPTGHPGILPAARQELTDGDIRSRVTGILDRLLYESTISNEILKLTGLADDADQLSRELLKFLSVISRYSAAGFLLRDGRDKYLLTIQTTETLSSAFIERARRELLQQAGLGCVPPGQVHFQLLQEAPASAAREETSFRTLCTLPISDQGELLGLLALFDAGSGRALGERTRHALNVAADRLLIVARYLKKFKEIEEVKGDFVSMLVHDMRAPLTSIRGFTDVLAEGILGSITEEQSTALGNIQSGCDRLLLLIEDILDLAKLEAGKMQIHPGPLDLRQLAERVCTDLSSLLLEKDLRIRIEVADEVPYVLADGKQLTRVLVNLLTNAVKFTPDGGTITIGAGLPEVCPTRKLDSCVQMSVTDTGPGIPHEQQQKLFARYQQLPAGSAFRKGTGLGLAICKEIILLHSGEIWVESPQGPHGGSRFCFTLPLA